VAFSPWRSCCSTFASSRELARRDAMSLPKHREPVESSQPVPLVVLRPLDLPFRADGASAIQVHPKGEQMPSAAASPARVVRAVVLGQVA